MKDEILFRSFHLKIILTVDIKLIFETYKLVIEDGYFPLQNRSDLVLFQTTNMRLGTFVCHYQ